MPAAEGEGQVGVQQAAQVGGVQFGGAGAQLREGEALGQAFKELSVIRWQAVLVDGNIFQQVRFFDPVGLGENAAAHDVKQHIGKMVAAGEQFFRNLNTVSVRHNFL